MASGVTYLEVLKKILCKVADPYSLLLLNDKSDASWDACLIPDWRNSLIEITFYSLYNLLQWHVLSVIQLIRCTLKRGRAERVPGPETVETILTAKERCGWDLLHSMAVGYFIPYPIQGKWLCQFQSSIRFWMRLLLCIFPCTLEKEGLIDTSVKE